jgi:hypothetical protein
MRKDVLLPKEVIPETWLVDEFWVGALAGIMCGFFVGVAAGTPEVVWGHEFVAMPIAIVFGLWMYTRWIDDVDGDL